MALKRQPHDLPPQTNTSDSESEDQQHSSSSDDSDSEPQQLTQSKPHQQSSQSDSDSDAEANSDSDSSSDKTHRTPSVVVPEPKKPTSKSTQLKANGKRPHPAEPEQIDKVSKSKKSNSAKKVDKGSMSDVEKGSKSDKSVKKSKVSNGDEESAEIEDKKGVFFTRLFTEKDEIVLLEGMIDFKEKKGEDPSSNIIGFHVSVEDLLSCSVTKSQIADKIRRLKKKYMNNLKRGRNGEDPVLSRPHEYKSFELSKKIWGSEVDGDSKVKSSRRKKDGNVGSKTPSKSDGKKESDFEKEVMDKAELKMEDCWSLYPCLCASLESEAMKNFNAPISQKEYVKKVVSGLKKEKARELEQDWKDYSVMEQKAYAKRVGVISKQAEAAMNAIQP